MTEVRHIADVEYKRTVSRGMASFGFSYLSQKFPCAFRFGEKMVLFPFMSPTSCFSWIWDSVSSGSP